MLVGVVAGVLLVVFGFRSILGTVEDYLRVPAATGGAVEIDQPGSYRVFHEGPGLDTVPSPLSATSVRATGPDGRTQQLGPPGLEETYSVSGREGRLIGTLTLAEPGTYEITVLDSGAPGSLALGTAGPLGSLVPILGGVFGGGAVFVTGLALLIVGSVLRANSRRRPPSPPAYPPRYPWVRG